MIGAAVSDKYGLALFSPEDAARYWKDIESSLRHVPHTWLGAWNNTDEIRQDLMLGRVCAWSVYDERRFLLTVFTRIVDDELHVIWACGDGVLRDAIPLLDSGLEHYAREKKLRSIVVFGRRGWERALHKYGYGFKQVVLQKPVVGMARAVVPSLAMR